MTILPDHVGIRFREIMSGHVASGATDPKRGERQGRERQERFRFDLGLIIASLNQFLAATAHVAEIGEGRVHWRGQAEDAQVTGGSVELYRRDPAHARRGTFEFRFHFADKQGAGVSAHGRKLLQDDRFLDAPGDLSTVFLQMEREGKPGGAGIVRVHPGELIRQLQSLQVTGAANLAERVEAKRRFFLFMNEELRRVYRYFPRLLPAA